MVGTVGTAEAPREGRAVRAAADEVRAGRSRAAKGPAVAAAGVRRVAVLAEEDRGQAARARAAAERSEGGPRDPSGPR